MTQTPLKLTPLHAVTERLGAKYVEPAGWRLPDVYSTTEAEVAAARTHVALADATAHGKLQIEGEAALRVMQDAFGAAPEAVGSGVQVAVGHAFRLRRDQFYLSTPPGGELEAAARLEAAAARTADFVTATDLTHGLAEIRLLGPASRDVLSKVCALDFHPDRFPDRSARQTSLARTKQMLIRRDFGSLPAFSILGAASLAAYVWEVLTEAGREHGLVPVGVAALRVLEGP